VSLDIFFNKLPVPLSRMSTKGASQYRAFVVDCLDFAPSMLAASVCVLLRTKI